MFQHHDLILDQKPLDRQCSMGRVIFFYIEAAYSSKECTTEPSTILCQSRGHLYEGIFSPHREKGHCLDEESLTCFSKIQVAFCLLVHAGSLKLWGSNTDKQFDLQAPPNLVNNTLGVKNTIIVALNFDLLIWALFALVNWGSSNALIVALFPDRKWKPMTQHMFTPSPKALSQFQVFSISCHPLHFVGQCNRP